MAEYQVQPIVYCLPRTADMDDKTREVLQMSRQVASRFATVQQKMYSGPSASHSSGITRTIMPSIINIDASSRTYSLFNTTTTTVVNHAPARKDDDKEDKKKKEGMDPLTMLIFSVVAAAVSYFCGKEWAAYNDVNEEVATFKEKKREFSHETYRQFLGQRFADTVSNISFHAESILNRNASNQFYRLTYLVSLLAASILGIAGGAVGSSALVTTALVLGIGATILKLGHYGYESASNRNQKEADKIQNYFAFLEKDFKGFLNTQETATVEPA